MSFSDKTMITLESKCIMGCRRTHELAVEKANETADKCGLWTRGGLTGVEVHIDDKIIHIPRQAILDLVAAEYVKNRIAKYEQMDTEDAIEDMIGNYWGVLSDLRLTSEV